MKMLARLVLALALPASAWATDYQYRAVDFPGAANTALYAVNDHRQFVGAEKDSAGKHHAIVGHGTQLALLDAGGPVGTAVQSWAFSINRHGEIAGLLVDAAGVNHGYVRRVSGAIEMIDFPGAIGTQAFGINDRGSVIGIYFDTAGVDHAFTLRAGQYANADLPGVLETVPLSINDAEEIAGEAVKTVGTIGFGYVQHRGGQFSLVTAPGSAPESTFFISINNRHEVLGAYGDAAGVQHNFIRRNGDYLPFDLPASFGASFVSAQTLNDHDDIVGYYVDANGVPHGFVATAGGD
jgi:hypothetical protein